MNVLFVDQFSDLGGAQLCLLDLLPAVLDRGWKAHVLIPGEGRFSERLAALGVGFSHFQCGPYRSGGKSAGDLARFARDLTSQIRTIRHCAFDLVYVNGPRVLPAAALATGRRAPLIFHAHNFIGQRYAKLAAGWAMRGSGATVVACSRFLAGSLLPYAGKCKVHVIANGTADLGFRKKSFEPGRLRVGIMGKLCREKGQIDFMQAAVTVSRVFPDMRFLVCGDGDQSELRKISRGVDVEFVGWHDNVSPILAQLDLLVIASRQEGFPRVLLEAFSAGVPVVAYPVGGIPEAIEDGKTGFLVPQCSPEALAARICGLRNELTQVAQTARSLWESRYTVTTYRQRILGVMEAAFLGHQAESATTSLRQHTG